MQRNEEPPYVDMWELSSDDVGSDEDDASSGTEHGSQGARMAALRVAQAQ